MPKTTIDRVDQKLDDLKEMVISLKDSLDKKYASKWVEKVLSGLIAFVLLSVLYAVLHNVIPTAPTPTPPTGVTAK
jgi:ABC-type uncharacterized transport system permease subunit